MTTATAADAPASANDDLRPADERPRYPSEQMLRTMLKNRGARSVHRELVARGYSVQRNYLDTFRAGLVRSGEAREFTLYGCCNPDPVVEYQPEVSSDRLLTSIRQLYYRTATERGCSVEAAQLMLNYSPAQLQRMTGKAPGTPALPFVPRKAEHAFTLGGVGSALL